MILSAEMSVEVLACLIFITAGNENPDLKMNSCIHFTPSLIHSIQFLNRSVRCSGGLMELKTRCLSSGGSQNY